MDAKRLAEEKSWGVVAYPEAVAWIFEKHAVVELLNGLGFHLELAEYLEVLAREIAASPGKRRDFLKLATPWVDGTVREVSGGEAPWQPLIAVAGFSKMMDRHRKRGISPDITATTARDLERRMLESRRKNGEWEFNRLNWMSNHVHRDLLEIGRLQYLPATYGAPYRVYTRRGETREMAAFPQEGISCSREGWMEKGAMGFITQFSAYSDEIRGNPVDFQSGRVREEVVALEASAYELRLSPESEVLHIHIPSGERLTVAACEDSRRRAAEVFGKCFPELPWVAWTCTSWLLDRELGRCLPPDSNIVAFGKLFSPLATPGTNSRQIMERVLEDTADWRSFQPQTTLQKAVLQHLAAGGSFRTTSGFILRD